MQSNTAAGIFLCNPPLLHLALRTREYTASTFFLNLCIIAASQQYLKERTMFEFEKQYKEAAKKIEQAVEQIKQVNEFWYNSVLSSLKAFYNVK